MELLRELVELQHEHGFLGDELLDDLAHRRGIPRYRIEGLVSFYTHFRREAPPPRRIAVCRDVVCAMHGAAGLESALAETGAVVEAVSCLGRCDFAPAVAINDRPAGPVGTAPLDQDDSIPWLDAPSGVPATPGGWACDPYPDPAERYSTVRRLAADLDQLGSTCIDHLAAAGLKGMGGAGFPAGRKWELVAAEDRTPKYVICNADESEPGTFKDRVLLAELPHLVIEGMVLAGLTIGAEQGIVFLRHEYEPERRRLVAAIDRARRDGVLGLDAAGSGRPFEIDLFVSPGGYILGEETALLEALEDRRGEPRNKPPYPGQHGLRGLPTLINNVETFALAVGIVHHGPDWWRDRGVGECSGLKFVSICGDVVSPGVYELPMGTTFGDLIDRAGGIVGNEPLKAFLPGGASSRFLAADRADTPIDFDAVADAGSMLGTGAVVVFAETRNLFDIATNLVRFFRNESCGKCVPCRIGSDRAVSLLEAVAEGSRTADELAELEPLNRTLEQTSICGLGQVALIPAISMLEHFPDEVPS